LEPEIEPRREDASVQRLDHTDPRRLVAVDASDRDCLKRPARVAQLHRGNWTPEHRATEHDQAPFRHARSLHDNSSVRRSLVLLAFVAVFAAAPSPVSAKLIVRGYPLAARCPAAGVHDEVDRWMMNACNCTSYVAWALDVNDQRIDWFVPGAMDAWNWPNVARLRGLEVGQVPRVGAVAVWPALSRPFGHVAYVTALHPDGTFDVSEYNLGPRFGYERFTYDARYDVHASGAEFIYVPRR
jgi:surface antigen